MKPIITSILDTDYYKLTMGDFVFTRYPDIDVKYEFQDRGKTVFPPGFAQLVEDQIAMMALLGLSQPELNYLKGLEVFSEEYLKFLAAYRFDPRQVKVSQDEAGHLFLEIVGPWKTAIYWETPLLRIISALNGMVRGLTPDPSYLFRAEHKAALINENGLNVVDFGARRAFSPEVHYEVLRVLNGNINWINNDPNTFFTYGRSSVQGTSNVKLAMEFDLPPKGTNAHECTMAHAAMYGVTLANQTMMTAWKCHWNVPRRRYSLNEWQNFNLFDLGFNVALTDTYTTEFFLRNLTQEMANSYGVYRQDSGDPIEVGEAIAKKLEGLGYKNGWIKILFSDSLTVEKAIEIKNHFKNRVQCLFGIGTSLTNDVGHQPLNIVIKATEFRIPYLNPFVHQREDGWVEVAKLSDAPGKYSGSHRAVEAAKYEAGVRY
jgi:nicotinate phosphoribosyltransferase